MSSPVVRVDVAETEAAEWYARLSTTVIAPQTIKAFFEWRSRPSNA